MSEKQYYDQEGEPVTLDKLCRTDPAWAASRIREMTAQRAQLTEENAEYQRENAALREAKKLDAAELGRLRKRVDGELRIKSEFLSSRQCPDHSGKWPRGRCLQCEIEQLQKALRKIEQKGHGDYHARGYSLANIAQDALAQSNDTPDAEGGVSADENPCASGHDFVSRGDGTAQCADCWEQVDIAETGAARRGSQQDTPDIAPFPTEAELQEFRELLDEALTPKPQQDTPD